MMSSTWQRHVHREEVWGTVVTFDLRGPSVDLDAAHVACAAAAEELHRIDAWLSPFRDDSVVTAIRNRALAPTDAPAPVAEVIDGCAEVTRLTRGAFNPWRAPGGFDPCGYVKGWGADRAAAVLLDRGFANVSVNAAGDVTCRGRAAEDVDGWRLGVADPRDRQQIIATVLVRDAHLATSGRYEQGDHIVDPETGRPVVTVDSASVLAADGGRADALATALLVQGAAGLAALAHEPVSALVITGPHAWSTGDAFDRGAVGRVGSRAAG
jgi:FAD:protein FMN transferase